MRNNKIPSIHEYMNESLDKVWPVRREQAKQSYVFDQWVFDADNGKTYAVRFTPANAYGKKVMEVRFGQIKGTRVNPKISDIRNIRKFIATVVTAIEMAVDNPTSKMANRLHGLILVMPNKVFDFVGTRIGRIALKRMRGKMRVAKNFFEFHTQASFSGIYIWKQSRRFSTIFDQIPSVEELRVVGDEPEDVSIPDEMSADEEPQNTTEPAQDSAKEPQPSDTPTPSPSKSEPAQQVSPPGRVIKPVTQSQAAEPQTGIDSNPLYAGVVPFSEKITPADYQDGMNAYFKLVINQFAGNLPISSKELQLGVWFYENHRDDVKIPHQKEYVLVLNMNGIQTPVINDAFSYSLDRMDLSSMNITDETTQDLILTSIDKIKTPTPIENVPEKQLIELLKSTRGFIKKFLPAWTPKVDKVQFPYPSTYQYIDDFSPAEKLELIGSIAKDIDGEGLEYTVDNNGWRHFDYGKMNDIKHRHLLKSALSSYAKGSSREEIRQALRGLPAYAQLQVHEGMFIEDPEMFKSAWIYSWVMAGGSVSQAAAFEALDEWGPNNEISSLWEGPKVIRGGAQPEKGTFNDPVIRGHLEDMYRKSQEFFKEKWDNRYENKKIKVYRGVGTSDATKYVPGAVESWSTQVSTAKKFATMMAWDGPGTVFMAEVPIQHILGSYESLKPDFPPDTQLKGKKEYLVLGGTFATTPMYVYNVKTKEVDKTLTFNEWANIMTEEDRNFQEADQVKIVTPDVDDFEKETSDKTGWAIDPREHLVKGLTDAAMKREEKRKKGEDGNE